MIGPYASIRAGIVSGIAAGVAAGAYVPTVAATLATRDLFGSVLTNASDWTARLTWQQLGTVGNGKILSLRFDTGAASVEVRDNEDPALGTWAAAPGTVGVLVHADLGDPVTVGALEAAINAGSALAQVTTADPSPSNEIEIATLDTANITGIFSGGV